MRLIVLLTSHNRKAKTLACLEQVEHQVGETVIGAVLLDDASEDGTVAAIASKFPWVDIHDGNGARYWNGGTYDAFVVARRQEPDFYLWLNDDTLLDLDAVARLLDAHRTLVAQGKEGVVVGSVRDPTSGDVTYGGVRRVSSRFRPASFVMVEPSHSLQWAHTMNGNCVLIPRVVVDRIGVNDPTYTHGMGDYDYGFRVADAGFEVVVAPRTVGTCSRNPPAAPLTGPFHRRCAAKWSQMTGPKGLPPRDWAHFLRRWGGPVWPIFWMSPYVKGLVGAACLRTGR